MKPVGNPDASGSSVWRHIPWLTALVLAPLMLGSVRSDAQAVIGLLLGVSLFFLAQEAGADQTPIFPRWFLILLVAIVVLPIVPLPVGIVSILSPERVQVSKSFPIGAGAVPQWLTLTISPARTMMRFWEIGLLITGFICARNIARCERGRIAVVSIISVGILLLAASDLWLRATGGRMILGIWPTGGGNPAGTFINRNHFANWMFVAILFCSGYVLRSLQPMRSARYFGEARVGSLSAQTLQNAQFPKGIFALVLVAIAAGFLSAIASGSRGAFLGFIAGGCVWLTLILKRSRRSGRGAIVAVGVIAVVAAALIAGGQVLDRLASAKAHMEGKDAYAKTAIWADGLRIFRHYPLIGTGWGTFGTAHTLYKNGLADRTAWHAENDYVQTLAEAGAIGTVVFLCACTLVAWRLGRHVARSLLVEPELEIGAAAALVAFAVHAVVEFVFQITATALLVSVILGVLLGCRDQTHRQVVRPLSQGKIILNWAASLALIGIALCLGWAALHWQRALLETAPENIRSEIARSLNAWPLDPRRQIGFARAGEVTFRGMDTNAIQTDVATVRAGLTKAISWDPLNWELRLERAWLDLNYSNDRSLASAEAMEAIRINPLQTEIPFRLAEQLVRTKDPLALSVLQAAHLERREDVRHALNLAWDVNGRASDLWTVTPPSTNGLFELGDFAIRKELYPMAAQAFLMMSNRVPATVLAQKLKEAHRPDLARRVFGQ